MRKEGCCNGESGGAGGGEEIYGVIVDPAAAFEGGAEEAVEEEAEDSASPADQEDWCSSTESPATSGSDGCGGNNARGGSAEGDGAICSGIGFAEGGDHAGMSAEDLAEFGGDGVGCGLCQSGEAESESRSGVGNDAACEDPAMIDEPGLDERIRDQGSYAEIRGDLGSIASGAALGGPEPFFLFMAYAGCERGENQHDEDGKESCPPGKVRKLRGCEHQAGGDGHSTECCTGGG